MSQKSRTHRGKSKVFSLLPVKSSDAAIIALLGHSYMSLIDLSLLKVIDVVKQNGSLVNSFVFSRSGISRFVVIEGYLKDIMAMVIERRLNMGHGLIKNCTDYAGLDPESCFFMDSEGVAFKMSKRQLESGSTAYEPNGMGRRFKSYSLPEGWTTSVLNDSFLMAVWKEASVTRQADAIRMIQEVTGLNPTTIRKKVYREPESTDVIVKRIF